MNVFGKLAAVVLVCSIGAGASAGVISYGDFHVTTAQFVGVQESGIEVGGVTEPLYGAPTLADNSLLFNPVSFGVMSAGLGSELCDGTLTVAEIVADKGYGIDALAILEAGDYAFVGRGTAATSVAATVSGFISILEINGLGVDPSNPLYTINFSQNLLSANLADSGVLGGIWSGSVQKSFAAVTGEDEVVTKLSVNIDNTLTATSESGTAALLNKKQFQLKVYTSDAVGVPEPSTLVLLGLGTLALLFFRRK